MKRFFSTVLFLAGVSIASGQKQSLFLDNRSVAWTINSLDTLVFDLSNISYSDGYILVPVYFNSDDTVYTIDFSMKFNLSTITYDSIIINHPGVYDAANFNWGDSTLYFTSYCLQPLPHDTPIITVRFDLLSAPISASDFNNVLAYLNGDECSNKIIPPPLDVSTPSVTSVENFISVYPNPAVEQLTITNFQFPISGVEIYDLSGERIFKKEKSANKLEQIIIDVSGWKAGVYIFKVFNDNYVATKKIVVQK